MATDQTAPEISATGQADPQRQRQQNRTIALMLAGIGALMLICSVGVAVLVLHAEAVYTVAGG